MEFLVLRISQWIFSNLVERPGLDMSQAFRIRATANRHILQSDSSFHGSMKAFQIFLTSSSVPFNLLPDGYEHMEYFMTLEQCVGHPWKFGPARREQRSTLCRDEFRQSSPEIWIFATKSPEKPITKGKAVVQGFKKWIHLTIQPKLIVLPKFCGSWSQKGKG